MGSEMCIRDSHFINGVKEEARSRRRGVACTNILIKCADKFLLETCFDLPVSACSNNPQGSRTIRTVFQEAIRFVEEGRATDSFSPDYGFLTQEVASTRTNAQICSDFTTFCGITKCGVMLWGCFSYSYAMELKIARDYIHSWKAFYSNATKLANRLVPVYQSVCKSRKSSEKSIMRKCKSAMKKMNS